VKPDRYLELCAAFALRPIRSEEHLEQALAFAAALDSRDELTDEEDDYLDVLARLIEDYEAVHHPIDEKGLTGAGMLKFLIESNHLSQCEVSKGSGIPESSLSQMLMGKRKIGVKHMTALGRFFHVDPGVFLDT
jgi:HTH-type transcriptional regulator/antitoxin HigA